LEHNLFTETQKVLIDYWLSLPRDVHSLLPQKNEVKIPRLARIASHLGMAEDHGIDNLQVRLIGSDVDENLGRNTQHDNAFTHYTEESWPWLNQYFRVMFDTPCGSRNDLRYHFSQTPLYTIQCMHLPLCDSNGTCKFLISTFERGGTVTEYERYQPSLIDHRNFSRYQPIDIGAGVGTPPAFPDKKELFEPLSIQKALSA
jgi:hypothetical protein